MLSGGLCERYNSDRCLVGMADYAFMCLYVVTCEALCNYFKKYYINEVAIIIERPMSPGFVKHLTNPQTSDI